MSQMRRVRGDAANHRAVAQEVPDLQEQGGAADFARLVHSERERMVRDRLRQEGDRRRGFVGIQFDHGKRQRQFIGRFFGEGVERLEAGDGE